MKKEEFIKLGLDEEAAKKCEKASEDELKDFVSRTDHEALVAEKKNLETSIKERNKQLEDLKNATGDVEGLKKQIENLQEDNKQKEKQHVAEIKTIKIDSAIESALMTAKAKNKKAVRALLDVSPDKIKVKEDGTLEGLDLAGQLKLLQEAEDSKFLFDSQRKSIKGAVPGATGKEDADGKVDVTKMTYSELAAYMAENPDVNLD